MKKNIISFIGYKRSGKDTAKNFINKKYNYVMCPSLAYPIKKSASEWFGWDDRHLDGELKEVVDPEWGISPREFFTTFGSDIMQFDFPLRCKGFRDKVGRNLWVKILTNWIYKQPNKVYLLSDMRFMHEYNYLNDRFNLVNIYIDRGVKPTNTISENSIPCLPRDFTVQNKSSLVDFQKDVDKIISLIGLDKKEGSKND